jgi:cellulose synthase (UDP-forming)
MAVFFMNGRQSHRQYERFEREVDCVITYGNRMIRAKTHNVSENGMSVVLNFPEYIPINEEVIVRMATERYVTSWKGKVANVINLNDKWKYGFQITEIEEADRREMLQIVYDSEPTLPKEIEAGLSTVDDLMINIRSRAAQNDYFSRKLPRVELSNYVETSTGQRALLRDFNYEFLTVQFLKGEKIPEELILRDNGIVLECTLVDKHARLGACYGIKNVDEINQNLEFRSILKSWIDDYETAYNEKAKYRKKVDTVLKKYEMFDELKYL